MTPIDDDHFDYDGGMRQCISGFGANAMVAIQDLVNHPSSARKYEVVQWHIGELVRWCRAFNGELQQLRANNTSDH